jgi:hypothetical protein
MIEEFRAGLDRVADRAARLHRAVLAAGSTPVVRAFRKLLDGTPSVPAADDIGAAPGYARAAGDAGTAVDGRAATAAGDAVAPAGLGEQMEAARRALRGATRSGTVPSGRPELGGEQS